MIYYNSEEPLHDSAMTYLNELENSLFKNDPFLLMKTLVDFRIDSKLNIFIDDFIDIIETINQNPNLADQFRVQTIDSNTLKSVLRHFKGNSKIQKRFEDLTVRATALK